MNRKGGRKEGRKVGLNRKEGRKEGGFKQKGRDSKKWTNVV